jgi:Zn-dependent peptidase ImmA (M78 family)/transcriptional regulator with XRE-family HTH domain
MSPTIRIRSKAIAPMRNEIDEEKVSGRLPGTFSVNRVHELLDPARLTQARHSIGITKRELASRMHVSPAAVGQYEAGTIKPRAEQLVRLADLLQVPVGFFAGGRPRAGIDVSMAHFRSLRATRRYEREQAVTFVGEVWELAYALSHYVRLPRLDLAGWDDGAGGEPFVSDSTNQSCENDPIAAAQHLRRRWQLGDQPIAHLVRTLESRGVIVAMFGLAGSKRIDAFSTSRTPRPVVVLTSDKDDVYRHRFNAAHELGHLVLHTEALPGDVQHEREANAFAAEFLCPAHKLAAELPSRVDFGALLRLQGKWGVSLESLLYRSQELGVLSDASHRRARIRLHELRAGGAISPAPIGQYGGEQPVLLAKAYELAADQGLTMSRLADSLALRPERIRDLLGYASSRPQLRIV